MSRSARVVIAAIFIAGAASTGCQEAARSLEVDGLPSAAAADALFGAVASRFGPIEFDPALRTARSRFAHDSLSPSRLLDDPALWTRRDGNKRVLDFGAPAGVPYRIGVRPAPVAATAAGAYRGQIQLESLGEDVFEWRVREELSIGLAHADPLAHAASVLLAGLEKRSETDLRALAHRNLSRSEAAFGRLVSLERIAPSPHPAGGTAVTVVVRLHPSGISEAFPHYAKFVEEYAGPARLSLLVADEGGVPFWDLAIRDEAMTLRFRVYHGSLAPLVGPPRPMPDRLRATASLSVKSGIFRVGFERLVADVALTRTRMVKAFAAGFQAEPDWQLPLGMRSLIGAPLHRPFEGAGSALSLGLRDAPGGPTRFEREYRLAVRENWLVRWLGSFGGGMVSVFRAGAESEADRFDGECLWALRDDLVALASARAE